MICTYKQNCQYTGLSYNCRVENVARVEDQPYPPGGTLRVMFNEAGQAIAGPLLSEVTDWRQGAA